ncbi:SIR2 family protein [Polaromonas sp. YR568]|uniref:SIR2 family protein n=1 Tax=Polaromonas sp. YR568 TaxID=1855301 RepID=UPI003137842A
MDYQSFVIEAANKRRTVQDLARFISTRTDNNPNYSLLFGAGCSISSGVRSATQLANLWRQELYLSCAGKNADLSAPPAEQRLFLRTNESSWYDATREYSSLFEKRYDLQRQRRMFVETEVAGKTPSIGYAYLTALVSQNYFNTIFTTNFDDILNEAFYVYSGQRPIVCAHDSSINSITVTSKRPKVIKIHGDYLFDDLKSTLRETENLEQNMKAKFTEFAKDYGLVVVGYSGGDRSVMDVVSALLRNEEFLKNGVYWCLRPGGEVSEELRKLIWRDRVYFVEVEGFDELFAELFSIFNQGEVLPPNAISIVHRPLDIANRLLSSPTAFPATSAILQQARQRLERQSKRTNLINLIARPDTDDTRKPFTGDGLDDDELAILAEAQNFYSAERYELVVEKSRNELKRAISTKLKLRLLELISEAYRALNDTSAGISVTEELIALQPKRAAHLLRKASFIENDSDNLKCIENAISVDPFAVSGHLQKAKHFSYMCQFFCGEERVANYKAALNSLNTGIELNPAWTNRCWLSKFNLIEKQELDTTVRLAGQREIIEQLKKQNPFSVRVLSMRQRLIDAETPALEYDSLLVDIANARERNAPDLDLAFNRITLKCLFSKGDSARLKAEVDAAIALPRSVEDADYTIEICRALREKFERDDEAIQLLKASLAFEFDADLVNTLVNSLAEIGLHNEARNTFERWKRRISAEDRSILLVQVLESEGNLDAALSEILRRKNETGAPHVHYETYLLLRKGSFAAAEELLRTALQKVNYSPEASVDIVNYELARKRQGHKVNIERLTAVMKFSADDRTHASINALLGKKAEMLGRVGKVLAADKTFRFQARDWPVFEEYRSDTEFQRLIGQQRRPATSANGPLLKVASSE